MNNKGFRNRRSEKSPFYWGAGLVLALVMFFYRNGGFDSYAITAAVMVSISGVLMIAASAWHSKRIQDSINQLIAEGYCVDADFETSQRPTYSTRPYHTVYNVWDYTIKCSYRDPSGTTRIFTDKIRLHFDPNFELTHRKTVKVYIDRNDPSNYYMDLSFLEELDKRHRG